MDTIVLLVGAIIAILAGTSLGWGLANKQAVLCLVAGFALLLSGVATVWAIRVRQRRQRSDLGKKYGDLRENLEGKSLPALRLGDILVNRYGLITPQQLQAALKRQRGYPKLLGQVLVEMGFITQQQLKSVLDEQWSWREFGQG